MSSIVLSAATRSNLQSAQDTASLLATTQTRLATGKKVNSALDSPVNFFTASGLDSRASDINNVLDSISNGVQVLQAANTGITSIQKLVDSAKSIANQALQTAIGYSTKSNVSTTIAGATTDNLLGTNTFTSASVTGNAVVDGAGTPASIDATTKLNATAGAGVLGAAGVIADGSTLSVNGHTITFVKADAPAASAGSGNGVLGNIATDGNGNSTVYMGATGTGTVGDALTAIDLATGVKTGVVNSDGTASITLTSGATASTVASGKLTISTGTAADLSITKGTGNALVALGLATSSAGTSFTGARTASGAGLYGKTLTFSSFASGTAVNVTFGDGTGNTVKSLDQLNTKLSANNMVATLDTNGKLTIAASNDQASQTIGSGTAGGTIGGTASSIFSAASAPVEDASSQTTRKSLLSQYNAILQQINTTAQDASYNGVNLLGGDTLKLVFNETGKSTLNITGVTFDQTGLGLATLGQSGANEFKDNSSINKVLDVLTTATTRLRTQASSLGSNLSVVQTRQEFNKSLINVLQTGSANLVNADLNEEAANSQALNTRQSLAVSALSLANTSQQSVLQLLR